jgi:DNA-binding HxlR family transcriptional regulator
LQLSIWIQKCKSGYDELVANTKVPDSPCSIQRSLGVLGERWTFLILREAFFGATRFAQFRTSLDIAPNLLSDRLATLVEHGVMTRRPYQEPGSRSRDQYELTPAGRELNIALGSLQQWGDRYLPRPEGPTIERKARETGRPVHVGFIDDGGHEVASDDVVAVKTPAYPR